MRENSSFFQHRHFLHDKFLSNDKYLQTYKHWYSQWCKRLFEIVLNHKGFSILSHILKKRGEYFPVMIIFLVMIIYVILRITFGLYSITRSWYDKVIFAVIFAGTFSLNLNFNRTSTMPLLTDSFCREQSMVY